MPKIVALVKDNTALKLMLAGIRVENTHDARTAETRLDELLESDTAVVIVQEAFRAKFSEFFLERLRRHKGLPLIVYCPAFEDEESNVDAYLSSVLKPAVGYEIRLE
jgi:vacuolar-type H+-ATPase subunit F/Vma7